MHCFTTCFTSAFILIQHTDSLTGSHFFSIPMWLLHRWSGICVCNEKSMNIHLPLIVTPSIIDNLCLMGQYPHTVVSKVSLFCNQPLIMYVYSIKEFCICIHYISHVLYRCAYWYVHCCAEYTNVDVHTSLSLVLCLWCDCDGIVCYVWIWSWLV